MKFTPKVFENQAHSKVATQRRIRPKKSVFGAGTISVVISEMIWNRKGHIGSKGMRVVLVEHQSLNMSARLIALKIPVCYLYYLVDNIIRFFSELS